MNTLNLICSFIIIYRIGCICASFPDGFLKKHRLRAFFVTVSLSLMATGAVATALQTPYGGELLLVSATLLIIFDRRAWSVHSRLNHECVKDCVNRIRPVI